MVGIWQKSHTSRVPSLSATTHASITQNRHNRPIVPSNRIPSPSARPLSNPAAPVPFLPPSRPRTVPHAIPMPHSQRLTLYCPSPIIHTISNIINTRGTPNAHAIHHWRLDSHLPGVRAQTKSTPPLPRKRTNGCVSKRKVPRLQKRRT